MSGISKNLRDKPLILHVEVGNQDHIRSRLDLWLAGHLPGVSRSKLQRMIRSGAIEVNGQKGKPRDPLKIGDEIKIFQEELEPSPMTPQKLELRILYEDDHLIVLDKPAGIAVHPGAGNSGPTLVEGLLFHVGEGGLGRPNSSFKDPLATLRPGIVHRLDKDTSGVMVCAKTDRAHAALSRQFQEKKVLRREYGAILDGVLKAPEVLFESWLARDPVTRITFKSVSPDRKGAKKAVSLFRVEEVFRNRLTLVGVRLFTGRTHQIRVHAKDLGAPIVGDLVYHKPTLLPATFAAETRKAVASASRQMLHARHLTFVHPESGQVMSFDSPYPSDFMNILALLRDPKNSSSGP